MDFHVASPLELFKNHIIHAATGVDERGRDDGEAAAFLNIPGCSEKPLGSLQGVRVDTARQNLSRGWNNRVIRPCQSGDRIQQDDHVSFVFHPSFGFLNHHFSHLDVTRSRLVERRADYLAVNRAHHVSDFFGPLINQQYD